MRWFEILGSVDNFYIPYVLYILTHGIDKTDSQWK